MFSAWRCFVAIIVLACIVLSASVPNSKPKNVYGTPSPSTVKPPSAKVSASATNNLPNLRSSLGKGSGSRRNYTGGQIITTRFGEQCECVTYHLCDSKDVFYDANGQSVDCGDKVCCSLPQTLTLPPAPILPGITTSRYVEQLSSEVPPTETKKPCTCVEAIDCPELTGSDKIISLKNSGGDCPSPTQICCPDKTSPPTVDPPITPSVDPFVTSTNILNPSTVPSTKCSCVAKNRCQDPFCSGNYGEGVIDDRSTRTSDILCNNGEACGNCDNSEICCPFDWISTDPYSSNAKECPEKIKFKGCGYVGGLDSLGQRVTSNGDETIFGEYPWMALILKKDETGQEIVVCGGSLLSSKVILTAAHCVNKEDTSTLTIRLGEYSTKVPSNEEKLPHQDRSISEVIMHEHFVPKINWNDVAIIIVDTPFEYAANVAPICVPFSVNSSFADPNVYDGSKCIVAGWGKNAYDGEYSTTLRKVDLEVVPVDVCQEKLRRTELGPKFILHASFTCAVGKDGRDSCKGDGGGPLFCSLKSEPNRYVQVGITSWGLKSCGTGDPGVYASAYYSSPWITRQFLVYNNFVINE